MSKINTDWMSKQERLYFENKIKRKRMSHFIFKNIPTSEQLEYELVSEKNYKIIFDLFGNDENPFVSDSYKTMMKLNAYTFYLIYDTRYSPKHAGCDWLFKLKDTQEYVGLLNMYDMSKENFANFDKQCTIGFSTNVKFRRKGYTTEAVNSLIAHIFKQYPIQQCIMAHTEKENLASQNLLKKLGFTKPKQPYYVNSIYRHFELRRINDGISNHSKTVCR